MSSSLDPLGVPRAALDWQVSDLDVRSARLAHAALDQSLRDAGTGRLVDSRCVDTQFPADLRGARHHMGTTRMHVDPRRGVVDADGRVHGLDNLYVAGSSVFPTSGSANPTLTIVALTLRLAHHLRGRLRTGAFAPPEE